MGKGKPRRRTQPETPIQAPQTGEENPARSRLRQEQLHRAEVRLESLLASLETMEGRLDSKLREANSMVKEMNRLDREANESVNALRNAIRFIAAENAAEIIQSEVSLAVEQMHAAFNKAIEERTNLIRREFDKLYEIMIQVRDRNGKKMPVERPDLRDMVAGIALDLVRGNPNDPPPAMGRSR